MYIGEVLFYSGIAAAVIVVLLLVVLLISSKRSKLYRKILKQESIPFEAFSATMGITKTANLEQVVQVQPVSQINDATTLEHMTILQDEGTMLEDMPDDIPVSHTTPAADIGPMGLDWSPLDGQYKYLEEIKGGGMSRIFKALKLNTGNEWIVKFIPKNIGEMTQEAEILRELNHVNLPAIIDIFTGDEGQFLVESYIEGVGMDQVLKSHESIPVVKIMDWAEQMAQVLSYLHNMKEPFLHLDLKPSNIMVTRDDRLVLIDFGISRRQSDTLGAAGATLSYAAPEQLKRDSYGKSSEVITKRFGELPEQRKHWNLDVRTDIYSLGVILFEAATGYIPQHKHMGMLRKHLPKAVCEIIYKCLEVHPDKRYQTIDALLLDIQNQKQIFKKIHFNLFTRRVAGIASAALVAFAVFGTAMGSQMMEIEAQTIMTVDPGIITLSLLQSSEVRLTRILPDTNEERPLNSGNLVWEIEANEIAQVDGNRIIGLNLGETTIHGQYRHNLVTVQVQVVEPMDGIVEISQRFNTGNLISLYAGTMHRERIDGNLSEVEFVGPGSLDITTGGAIYLADAGILRRIYNGSVETITINPPFLAPSQVRAYGEDVFILTDPWYDEGGFYYGIIRLAGDYAEGFFLGDAQHTAIRDFEVQNGLIYFIEWNAGLEMAFLRTINVNDAGDIYTIIEVPENTSAMAIDTSSSELRVYLADSERGVLMVYENGEISYLAGVLGERAFIDGPAPLFYQPQRLRYIEGSLYVWDFNVLREVRLQDGLLLYSLSIAGNVSPVYDMQVDEAARQAERVILPYSQLMDFVVLNNGTGYEILVTDPKRGVIWQVEV